MKALLAVKDEDDCKILREAMDKMNFGEGVEFILLHVVPALPAPVRAVLLPELAAKFASESRLQSRQLIDALAIDLQVYGRVHRVICDGHAVEQIILMAKQWEVDCIILGSLECLRQGISTFYACSVSRAVAANAPCSVLVLRDPGICGFSEDGTRVGNDFQERVCVA